MDREYEYNLAQVHGNPEQTVLRKYCIGLALLHLDKYE